MTSIVNFTLRLLRLTIASAALFFFLFFALAFTFDCSMERLRNRVSVAFVQSVRAEAPIRAIMVDRLVGLEIADFDSVMTAGGIAQYETETVDEHVTSAPSNTMGLIIEMPGVYVVSTLSEDGVANEPFFFLFDEQWVQNSIEGGSAQLMEGRYYETVEGCEINISDGQPVYRSIDALTILAEPTNVNL